MILEIIILFLSVALMFSMFVIRNLFNKNIEIQKEKDSMKESVDSKVRQLEHQIKIQEELVSIEPGDKAILSNYGLSHKPTNESFTVTYEVEIVEVSTKKVKVNAIDYTSNDTFPSDPKNKKSIISFLQDTWVDRKSIELIVDDQMRREKKLNQILN